VGRRRRDTNHLNFRATPLISLPFPRSRSIHRHEDRLHPHPVYPLQQRLGLGSIPIDVELHEEWLLGRGSGVDDLCERGGGVGGDLSAVNGLEERERGRGKGERETDHLDDGAFSGGGGEESFALRVGEAGHTGWRYEDLANQSVTEEARNDGRNEPVEKCPDPSSLSKYRPGQHR
jgi:hypothetical protein